MKISFRKISLSTRIIVSFLCLCTLNGVMLLYLGSRFVQQPANSAAAAAFYAFLLMAALLLLSYLFIYPAYLKARKQYSDFLSDKIYEELFTSSSVPLTPELSRVFQRFHTLLNKQDSMDYSQKQAEYLALQNQINPHFLYNTLEAIRGDALYAGLGNIAETTEALAAFFRYTITDVGALTTLESEIDNIENYFIIQQYRFGDKIKMEIKYPEDGENIWNLQLPKLTLQPIIENAIFHGLEKKRGYGTITISIETTEKFLFVNITDTGIGIEPEILNNINNSLEKAAISYVRTHENSHGNIALKNVSRRIKLIFGDEYGLQIYSTIEIGTNVHLVLPKIKK